MEESKKEIEDEFELILVDIKEDVINSFKIFFKDLPRVKIIHSKFEDLEGYDCIVSAANSFGLMDGLLYLKLIIRWN